MNSPSFEQHIGIHTYYTRPAGIGGKLRRIPEDFRVIERFSYPPKKDQGRFTIAEVSSVNWETHTLVGELATRLHVSEQRIEFAGTKDKRAVTTQLMSFFNIPVEKLQNVRLKDVQISNVYTADQPVRIGDLAGNTFDILIRMLDKTVTEHEIDSLISPIQTLKGFPNYYGIQRFGIIRPITHLVGRAIINGDFEQAVMTYIANPMPEEPGEIKTLRQHLASTHDFSAALEQYPNSLNFEKMMLRTLVKNPKDFIGALQALPKNLLMLFISAYQAFLFNKILSERIRQDISLDSAMLGDRVFPVRNSIVDAETIIPVQPSNIDKVNQQLQKKRAVLTGALFGSDTPIADGIMGDIEQQVYDNEKITPRDFIIADIPFLSSSGARRALLAFVDPITWTLTSDDLQKGKQALRLQFFLQKGCYATCLLRELMKSPDPRDY